jgi:hypothetical protein
MQPPANSPKSSIETTVPADSTYEPESGAVAREKAFGIWPTVEDGLIYQERLRSEWGDRGNE